MTAAFSVRTSPRFNRLLRALHRQHTDIVDSYAVALIILAADPHNQTRQYRIKKLIGIRDGDGQYRLSLGRWRFRYDIFDREVILQYCGLRREDTYR